METKDTISTAQKLKRQISLEAIYMRFILKIRDSKLLFPIIACTFFLLLEAIYMRFILKIRDSKLLFPIIACTFSSYRNFSKK